MGPAITCEEGNENAGFPSSTAVWCIYREVVTTSQHIVVMLLPAQPLQNPNPNPTPKPATVGRFCFFNLKSGSEKEVMLFLLAESAPPANVGRFPGAPYDTAVLTIQLY